MPVPPTVGDDERNRSNARSASARTVAATQQGDSMSDTGATTPATRRTRTDRNATIIILIVATATIIGLSLIGTTMLGGIFPARSTTHPPCAELPHVDDVKEALLTHSDLANDIESQGDTIRVAIATPCTANTTLALIEVSYTRDHELDAIDDLLTQRNGFGVPVHVTQR